MENIFEIIGYQKEYYVKNKYYGSVSCEKDREKFGYYGRQTETLEQDVVLSNGKKIKKGSVVMTELQQICGKKL